MAHSLDIYGRADAASVLDPLGRSLFADEKRQDKQSSKASQSDPGGELIKLLGSSHIVVLQLSPLVDGAAGAALALSTATGLELALSVHSGPAVQRKADFRR